MIGFYQRIINGKTDKISYKLYKILLAMHQHDLFHSKWRLSIRNILYESHRESSGSGFHTIRDEKSEIKI